jgi:hypothetical protein
VPSFTIPGVASSNFAVYKTALSYASGSFYTAIGGSATANGGGTGFPSGMASTTLDGTNAKLYKIRIYVDALGSSQIASMT